MKKVILAVVMAMSVATMVGCGGTPANTAASKPK